MRTIKLAIWSLCLVAGTALVTSNALSQDGEPSEAVKNGMKMYQGIFDKARELAPEHALLKKLSGEWAGTSQTWTSFTPKDQPLRESWTRSASLEMDGLFLTDHVKGTFVGAPFEGFGVVGFDKEAKEFVNFTRHNLGTTIIRMTGSFDEAGKVLTLKSDELSMMGMKFTKKEVLTLVDDDTIKHEMSSIYANGMEMKEVELEWKRAK